MIYFFTYTGNTKFKSAAQQRGLGLGGNVVVQHYEDFEELCSNSLHIWISPWTGRAWAPLESSRDAVSGMNVFFKKEQGVCKTTKWLLLNRLTKNGQPGKL